MDGSLLHSKYLNQLNATKQQFGFFSEAEKNNIQSDPFYVDRNEAVSMLALIDTIAPYLPDAPLAVEEDGLSCDVKYKVLHSAVSKMIESPDAFGSMEAMARHLASTLIDLETNNPQ